MPRRLPRSFFNRPTLSVARDVLGARLVRIDRGRRLSGVILEAEAYVGREDLGCHASRGGRTPRNAAMFGPPGHAYIYFTYGMHWMLNLVTEPEEFPAAVLVRALLPLEGTGTMRRRRNRLPLCAGPATICQAFGLDGGWNCRDLCSPDSRLFLEEDVSFPDSAVTAGPRVGLYTVPEPWKSIPWRFRVSPAAAAALELARSSTARP